MLLEKNAYPNDFPMNIQVGKIIDDPIHYHQDIEFVLVLQGEVQLKNGAFNYLLHEGDVFTNNGHEVHSIQKSTGDNVVAVVSVSNLFFTQYFPALTKSSYRTYNEYEGDPRRDNVRKMLLMMLLDYYKRSLGYKQKCTDLMLELIKYLNACFNLFTYKNRTIVNVDSGNLVQIERMTRIINYIYECHAQKLTLKDLAELEHLNEFYISHIIKESTGMSFQELLGFARSEWSEILLLESNKPVSKIARDVGFSGTALYEKHFIKWFGHSPEEHRALYQPRVKGPLLPESTVVFNANQAIHLIQQNLSQLQSQDKSKGSVKHIKLDVQVNVDAEPLYKLAPRFILSITPEDYTRLGHKLFDRLADFNCRKVQLLAASGGDDARQIGEDADSIIFKLEDALVARGYEVEKKSADSFRGIESYGLDSLAGLVHLLKENLQKRQGEVQLDLMDGGDDNILLKGLPSLLTARGIPKPSYYGASGLSMLQGSLLTWGKYYSVVRLDGKAPGYVVVAFHYNDEMEGLCVRNATVHETRDVLDSFIDELDINFSLRNLSGEHRVTRYSMDAKNNLFDYMAKLDFRSPQGRSETLPALLYAMPSVEVYTETPTRELGLNVSLKGAGAQFVVVQKVVKEGISE
jgi:AraC-like DNA-binding protein